MSASVIDSRVSVGTSGSCFAKEDERSVGKLWVEMEMVGNGSLGGEGGGVMRCPEMVSVELWLMLCESRNTSGAITPDRLGCGDNFGRKPTDGMWWKLDG